MRRKKPGGQLLQMQSRCISYIQWSRRFIHTLKMFDPRFVLRSHNGAWCLKPEEADMLCFYNSKQSDMLNLCLQKHFIKKGHGLFKCWTMLFLLCKDRWKSAEEERVRSFPLQGQQLGANLRGVPQIEELAGKLCVAAGKEPLKIRSWRSRGRWVRVEEQGKELEFWLSSQRGVCRPDQ